MNEEGASVATYLSNSADLHPDLPALVSGADSPAFPTLSFCELDQSVDRAANELLAAGISQGKKTLLLLSQDLA